MSMDTTSLTVIGSGIKFMSHLTQEALAYIESSDKVLYLVNEPAMKAWIIKKKADHAENLEDIYHTCRYRKQSYQLITQRILTVLNQHCHVCVVMYGHPTVLAESALEAVKVAKKQGFFAQILPGISSEDCLYADLLIDPASSGCQSFDATDFLIYRRKFDPSSHLILWQPNMIGALVHANHYDGQLGLTTLQNYLENFYEKKHGLILYEAARYPRLEPVIERISLNVLNQAKPSGISTLYIPPGYHKKPDLVMLAQLQISLNAPIL